MKENNINFLNKIHFSLNNLDKYNDNLKYEQLFTLYDSVINSKSNKILSNLKIDNNNNENVYLTTLKSLNSKNHNLINDIINKTLNNKKINLFHKHYKNKNEIIKSDENRDKKINIFNNNNKTFLTNTNIQANKPINANNTEENKSNYLGISINDIFIKNINEEMIKKGILIQRPISNRKKNKTVKHNRHNYNNYEAHMDIFSEKLKKEFNDYLKEMKLAEKKNLRSLSKKIADKKEKITKNIPIYIKCFDKNFIDIFHSRKIYDLEYQSIYRKPSVNIEEILHYQNKNSNNNFKKGKIPFYYFLRTVNNPYDKKTMIKKRAKSGEIYIKINKK